MAKRGGAREGAGKKPISKKFSDALKKDVFAAMQKKAKQTGKTIGEVLIDLCYNEESSKVNIRMVALKMLQEVLLIRETKTDTDIDIRTNIGPTIGLPPLLPRPKEEEVETAEVVH